jgi:hypothetical protein
MAETIYSQVTSEQFMRLAADGQIPKDVLAERLEPATRRAYLDACAAIERRYTEACDAEGDPCLESGCSIDHEHGEVCLQPLLRSDAEYQKACGEEWLKVYQSSRRD